MGFEPASDILSKYTVLDLTRVRSGPTCVRQLGDWGANVIRIENPHQPDMVDSRDSSDFQNLQRNKRSITLDLKKEEAVEIFFKLAKKADVIVENYRPDVKFRLGIDYEKIKQVNSKIVYASISGFGQDGPLSGRPGFDQIAQGMGGLMSITGKPGDGPMRVGIPIADLCAGNFAAQGVLLALLGVENTGKGQWIQTSLLQAQIYMLDFQAARWLMDRDVALQAGNDHPKTIPTGVFETSDGHINIAVAGNHIWERLKKVLNDDRFNEKIYDEPNSRSKNRITLNALINENTRKDTSDNWIALLNENGVPCGEINSIDKVFNNPQVKHLGIAENFTSQERGKTKLVGQPIIMSDSKFSVTKPPPKKGQHTDEILKEFGYDIEQINNFRKNNIL